MQTTPKNCNKQVFYWLDLNHDRGSVVGQLFLNIFQYTNIFPQQQTETIINDNKELKM